MLSNKVVQFIFLLGLFLSGSIAFALEVEPSSKMISEDLPTGDSSKAIELFLPGVQMRYQDTSSQAREMVNHYLYSINYSINELVGVGFEFSRQQEASGNEAFKIGRTYNEYSLVSQINALQKRFSNSSNLPVALSFGPRIVYGFGESTIITSLQGQSREDQSERQSVFGAGAFVKFNVNSFLVEGDLRYQSSKNYEPNAIWLGMIRLGYSISL